MMRYAVKLRIFGNTHKNQRRSYRLLDSNRSRWCRPWMELRDEHTHDVYQKYQRAYQHNYDGNNKNQLVMAFVNPAPGDFWCSGCDGYYCRVNVWDEKNKISNGEMVLKWGITIVISIIHSRRDSWLFDFRTTKYCFSTVICIRTFLNRPRFAFA